MFSHPLHRSVLKQIMLLPSSSLRTLEVNSDLTISSAANILYIFIHSIGMRRPSTTNMAAPHTSSPKLRAIHPPSQILQEKSRSILANRDNLLNSHALAVSQPVSLSPYRRGRANHPLSTAITTHLEDVQISPRALPGSAIKLSLPTGM